MNTEIAILEPFDSRLSKKEMDLHIQTYHAYNMARTSKGEKWTKDDAIRWHSWAHELIENEDINQPSKLRQRERFLVGYVPHVHQEITVRGITGETNLAKALTKPLTSAQKRALLDLVDNDFHTLRKEMEVYGAELATQRLNEVNKKWDRRKDNSSDVLAKANELVAQHKREKEELDRKHQQAKEQLRIKAEKSGVTLYWSIGRTVPDVKLTGRENEVKAVKENTDREMRTALLQLERERLSSRRQIMLAGVPKESLDLLSSIPDAKTLMQTAADARKDAAKQIAS